MRLCVYSYLNKQMKEKIMTDFTMLDVIKQILVEGGDVSVVLVEDELYFNMNSGTKAHLYVSINIVDNTIRYTTRYDNGHMYNIHSIADAIEEITYVIRFECMCGRDFVSDYWIKKFIEYGYAEEVKRTEIVFK
jgi:hypothetical protein